MEYKLIKELNLVYKIYISLQFKGEIIFKLNGQIHSGASPRNYGASR